MGMNSRVTITGLTKPAGTNNMQASWTTGVKYQDLLVYIEKRTTDYEVMMTQEASGKLFRLITAGEVPLVSGDKVEDNRGRVFVVRGVRNFVGDSDIPDHTECDMLLRYPGN